MPYAAALALTLAVEVPIYVAALSLGAGWRLRRAALVAVLVNLATHPLAWLILLRAGTSYPLEFWLVESGVWLVEAALLWAAAPGRPRRDAWLLILIALVANTGSALAGVGAWLLGW